MGKYLVRIIYLKINPLSSIFVLALHVGDSPLYIYHILFYICECKTLESKTPSITKALTYKM